MDKYILGLPDRKAVVNDQIYECQKLIYRNNLENLTFKQKKDEDKQLEVETNNNILKRKLDLLFEELGRLQNEDSNSPTV